MQFIDLAVQQQRIRESIESRIRSVLNHGQYIMGPEVKELEETLSAYVGVKHAVGCASGTDALLLALMAHGTGPGDAIFTTPFTFMATAEVVALLGATPVFVDIDPVTFNMDPARLEMAITAVAENRPSLHPLPAVANPERLRRRGIIAVDLFGLPADYERINRMAENADLLVIQDAAQSFGALAGGKRAGAMSRVGCTSFFPAKPLGAYGDGGMCFTDDDEFAERIRSIRIHGQGANKYDNVRIGINGRLDTLQAAILLAKFELFPEELDLRNNVARRYAKLLSRGKSVMAPAIPTDCVSAWAQYSVLARDEDHRARIQARLKQGDVPTAVYYPKPLHLQEAFASLGYKAGDFPVSEACARRIFSIPMHPYLNEEDQRKVVDLLLDSH
jgi:UDP-2-acetamido-2-deoxy-ribo-hexuluronate aminotransferase